MGKRNAYDNIGQQNYGPHSKRTRLNGNHQHQQNGDESSSEESASECDDSPKPEFLLTRELVDGTILTDITLKEWRIGKPIGKGSFGEIFLASDDVTVPVTSDNAKYVVKIEPHSNGPLFVEIHCLLNTAKKSEENPLPPGIPEYIASGSHYFKKVRYRFLVLRRFDCDLHSIIKNKRVDPKSVPILAVQILDVLEHLHDKGYCHSDIKAENLMIGKCTFHKSNLNDESGISSEDDTNAEDDEDECSNEEEIVPAEGYQTPQSWKRKSYVQYSGSNPVRSCRLQKRNSTYQEMVKSHYLRPTKKINYSEFDENSKSGEEEYTLDEYLTRQKLSNNRAEDKISCTERLVTEDRIFLIDFGLASKFIDSNGVHRPFCMDQRRAHDGTLEFTSRDAHMGAHSRRSDLECLGYNLIYWSQGYLPWKDCATQNQHERVHWMKEYLMTEVKVMLKHVYGKSVPKYLGEFMQYVGKLAYHERPDYKKCKRIFQREFIRLGYKKDDMVLNVNELRQKTINCKEEIENNNIFEMKNIKSIMKNLGVLLPFRESNSNRVSPKNLRSKSEKQSNKKRKKFSWAEILSQDPDQIARERAEKEFEREQTTETPIIKYSGKPTYAILEIENRIKFKDRLEASEHDEDELLIKGYTKPMMEVLKKRQIAILAELEDNKKNNSTAIREVATKPVTRLARPRTKAGLRTVITPTKRGLDYNHEMVQRRAKRSHKNSGDFTTDESSCSSLNSVASNSNTTTNVGKIKTQYGSSTSSSLRGGTSSLSCASGLSDEDTRDVLMVFSPKRTRHATSKIINETNNLNKRKKSIPRKRNSKGEIMRCV